MSLFPIIGLGDGKDPYFANVAILLHGDGSDTSTTITDSSNTARDMTAVNQAQLDTTQKKFGTASILFDGSDLVTTPMVAGLQLGSATFTLEAWVRFASVAGNLEIASSWAYPNFVFRWLQASSELALTVQYPAVTYPTVARSWSPSADTWYFVQLIRTGTTIKMAVDGAQLGADLSLGTPWIDGITSFNIGGDVQTGSYMNGWIDEFRLTVGTARDIALPTKAFPNA